MLRKIIKEAYPQRNKAIYILFDFSFLLYLVAYFVYYHDQTGFDTIRMVATVLLFGSGVVLSVVTKSNKINTLIIWYFLFILVGFFSIIWAKYDNQITSIMIGLLRNLLIFFFLSARVRSEKDLELLMGCFVLSVIYLNLYVAKLMIDFYTIADFYLHRFGDNFAYNSNSTAILNVFCFLILMHWMRKTNKPAQRALILLLQVFFVAIITITGSKKGLLGLLLGVFFLSYQRVKGIKKFERIFLGLIIAVGAMWCVLNIQALYDIIGYRVDELLNMLLKTGDGGTSSRNRAGLIRQAIDVWLNHPVFGVGLNNFSQYQTIGEAGYYAHNNYVELLADLGVIGFGLYYSIFVGMIKQKVDSKVDVQLLMKTAVWIILFFDIGSVSYQDIRIHVFVCFAYLTLRRLKYSGRNRTLTENTQMPYAVAVRRSV